MAVIIKERQKIMVPSQSCRVKMLAEDEKKDIAVLTFDMPSKDSGKLELYSPFSPKQKEIEPMFKGDPIDGMSGGPVISLEQQGDPKLAGLNSMHLYTIQSPRMRKHLEKKYFEVTGIHNFQERLEEAGYGDKNRIGKEITSDEIITFLKKNNLYEK